MYCTVHDVKLVTGIKPNFLRLEKDDDETLDKELRKLILQSESLINSYIHHRYEDSDVPKAVENVCIRLTANMIAFIHARHDTPITKVNDWSVEIISSAIFTQDLKDDLQPFIVDKSTVSDKVEFEAITGETLW